MLTHGYLDMLRQYCPLLCDILQYLTSGALQVRQVGKLSLEQVKQPFAFAPLILSDDILTNL